jgi:uncharacterized protein (DUF1499 family)
MDGAVDFSTLQLSEKPNQYLVCPAGECGGQAHMASPVFEVPVAALKDAWSHMLANQPRIEVLGEDSATNQIVVVQRSKLMHFPDTVTVAFVPLGEKRSTLYVYSRSTYGYSDLGVNAERIQAWLATLAADPAVAKK